MKIFITGGFGYVGRNFIKKYLNQYEFVIFTKTVYEKEFFPMEKVKIMVGSVDDTSVIDAIKETKPDIVMHLTAKRLRECEENPECGFKVNVLGTLNVIKGCNETNSRLIFLSSREVYGETQNNESNEDESLLPNNVYGITKMLAEKLIRYAAEKDLLKFTIIRPANIYGEDGINGINLMIKDGILKKSIKKFGGEQILNLIYIEDFLEGLNMIIQKDSKSNEIFNLGSENSISINDLVKIIMKLINDSIKIENHENIEYETKYFKPNNMKFYNKFGFKAKTSLEEGIKKTLELYKFGHNF